MNTSRPSGSLYWMVRQTGQNERWDLPYLRCFNDVCSVLGPRNSTNTFVTAMTRSPPSRCDLWICREESSRIFGNLCECLMESDHRWKRIYKGSRSPCVRCSFRSRLNDRVPELVDDDRRSKRTLPIWSTHFSIINIVWWLRVYFSVQQKGMHRVVVASVCFDTEEDTRSGSNPDCLSQKSNKYSQCKETRQLSSNALRVVFRLRILREHCAWSLNR
jgi:hypothetical protein